MGLRAQREQRLAAYESPAFAAGRVGLHAQRITILAAAIQREAAEACQDIAEWQRRTAEVAQYEYKRERVA